MKKTAVQLLFYYLSLRLRQYKRYCLDALNWAGTNLKVCTVKKICEDVEEVSNFTYTLLKQTSSVGNVLKKEACE